MPGKRQPVVAAEVPQTARKTDYPQPYAALMEARTKRKLGDLFGLSNFGVNLTSLEPGGTSALNHSHSRQDEFIYVVSGSATLRYGDQEHNMSAGECIGFPAGTGIAHQIANRGDDALHYLEIGDRSAGDAVDYPDDDLRADLDAEGQWVFSHNDGTPYD